MKNFIVIILCMSTVGCAIMERAFLVPQESVKVNVPHNSSPEEVLDIAINSSIKYFLDKNTTVTYKSPKAVEIGPWRESNVIGYSAKAKMIKSNKQLKISVKGTNVYYNNLPVINSYTNESMYIKHPMKYTINNIKTDIQKTLNDKYRTD